MIWSRGLKVICGSKPALLLGGRRIENWDVTGSVYRMLQAVCYGGPCKEQQGFVHNPEGVAHSWLREGMPGFNQLSNCSDG